MCRRERYGGEGLAGKNERTGKRNTGKTKDMEGKFITFEGCEGAGKSTQIRLLSEYLTKCGVAHTVTREPGGSEISEAIRRVILNGKFTEMTDECEALLYAAARAQHLSDTVLPALRRDEIVLCDRYIFSSFAYQGYGRGLSLPFLRDINAYAIQNFMPDVTLFLNIAPVQAFARKHGADENDRIEQAGEAFHQRVYEGYLELLQKYPESMVSIDCSGSKFETHGRIVETLRRRGIV